VSCPYDTDHEHNTVDGHPEPTIGQMLASAAKVVAELPILGMKARAESRATVAMIEKRVMAALDGAKLIGLPNLGTSNDRFNGINVRADTGSRKLKIGKPTLAIDRDGSLVMVCFGVDEIVVEAFDASRAGVRDLVDVAESYTEAFALHLRAANRAARHYVEIQRLAASIREAMAAGDAPGGR